MGSVKENKSVKLSKIKISRENFMSGASHAETEKQIREICLGKLKQTRQKFIEEKLKNKREQITQKSENKQIEQIPTKNEEKGENVNENKNQI